MSVKEKTSNTDADFTVSLQTDIKDITLDTDTKSNVSSTIHYLSPASLTRTTLHPEDYKPYDDFYQYLYIPGSGAVSGEFTYSVYSSKTSETYEVPQLERTCAIIKPDAVYFEDVILRKIHQQGFKILQKRKLHLTPEQVSELYSQHYGSLSFPYLVVSMSAGPVIVMCLAAIGAVQKWKNLVRGTGTLGCSWFCPKSMRLRFGCQGNIDNVLHASEDLCTANKEIRYFFPRMILEPLLKFEPEVTDFLAQYVNPTLLDALTELCKKKPIEPLMFFSEWLLLNNPYQPKMKPEIAQLPT